MTFAKSLDPGLAPQNIGPDLDSNCLTLVLVVILKEIFKKDDFEKNQRTTKHTKIYQECKELNPLTVR